MQINQIKVFGERHSGNNYLMQLLLANFDKKYFPKGWVKDYGWTHGLAKKTDDEKTLFILIYRNPVSWALAMHKNPHSDQRPNPLFRKFIRSSFEDYYNPILMRTYKLRENINTLKRCPTFLVSYESLLSDAEKGLNLMTNLFSLSRSDNFQDIKMEAMPNGTIHPNKMYSKRHYNLSGFYMDYMSKEDAIFIEEMSK